MDTKENIRARLRFGNTPSGKYPIMFDYELSLAFVLKRFGASCPDSISTDREGVIGVFVPSGEPLDTKRVRDTLLLEILQRICGQLEQRPRYSASMSFMEEK